MSPGNLLLEQFTFIVRCFVLGCVRIIQSCLSVDQGDVMRDLKMEWAIEMFYLNSTLNFGIPPVLVFKLFKLEVYYKVDRLLAGLTAQQKGTTARWYSNKTSLVKNSNAVMAYHYLIVWNSPHSYYVILLLLHAVNT